MTTYPGGKAGSGVYQKLINLMPKHSIYVEPFLGGGSIMKYKRPAPLANIAIDADASAIRNFGIPPGVPGYQGIVGNALDWLQSADVANSDDSLIYCDPPYLMSTRRIQDRPIYRFEMTDADHVRLLSILTGLRCMVMVSGYPSDLYDNALSPANPREGQRGWRRVTYYAMTRGGSMAQEVVWLNFPEPFELHDYRYLGENFRQRERIKRKIARWKGKLRKMDALEGGAYDAGSIAESGGTSGSPGNLAEIGEVAGSITHCDDGCR